MPWINLTVRRGTFTKEEQHALMAKLTDTLMYWEKVPDTPEARKFMKGWVYEMDEDSDYSGGSPRRKDPSYFIEVRLPAGRFDTLTKLHLIRDFTRIIMLAEGKQYVSPYDRKRNLGGDVPASPRYQRRRCRQGAYQPATSAARIPRRLLL